MRGFMFVGSQLAQLRKRAIVPCLGHQLGTKPSSAWLGASEPCFGRAHILWTQSHEQASDHLRKQNLLFKLFFYSVASHLILRFLFLSTTCKKKILGMVTFTSQGQRVLLIHCWSYLTKLNKEIFYHWTTLAILNFTHYGLNFRVKYIFQCRTSMSVSFSTLNCKTG
jgi:hypothetical protein